MKINDIVLKHLRCISIKKNMHRICGFLTITIITSSVNANTTNLVFICVSML